MKVTWHHYYTAGPGNPVVQSEYTDPAFLNTYVADAKNAETQFLAYVKGQANCGWGRLLELAVRVQTRTP